MVTFDGAEAGEERLQVGRGGAEGQVAHEDLVGHCLLG